MNRFIHTSARVVCAAVLLFATGAVSAQSVLSLTDHTTGETSIYTEDNALFSVVGDGHAIDIGVGLNAKSSVAWNLRFEAPAGETFHAGRYDEAGCPFVLRTGRAPGMQITDNNPLCRPSTGLNSIWGSFAIRQIAYDNAGHVTSLEILFAQRAGSPQGPLLTGLLRYGSAPLSLRLDSDPGFALGDVAQRYDGDSSFFSLAGTTAGVEYTASVPRDRWTVKIVPPLGEALHPGVYNTLDLHGAKRAGLTVQRGLMPLQCRSTGGKLTILDMDVAPSGEVLNLYATFEYRCGGVPALRGTIRYLQ
ncbi:MAG: hypothetical protein ABJA62_11335 [Luteimonas sp.]